MPSWACSCLCCLPEVLSSRICLESPLYLSAGHRIPTPAPPPPCLPHAGHPAAPLTPAQSWNVPGMSLPSVLPQSRALGTRVPPSSSFLGFLSMSAKAWRLHPHLSTCCLFAHTQHRAGDWAGFVLKVQLDWLSVSQSQEAGKVGHPTGPSP